MADLEAMSDNQKEWTPAVEVEAAIGLLWAAGRDWTFAYRDADGEKADPRCVEARAKFQFAIDRLRAADARLASQPAPLASPEEKRGERNLKHGQECVAQCGAPARYVADGICLYVSAQDNSLQLNPARLRASPSPDLPLPTDGELEAALAGLTFVKHRRGSNG